MSPPRRCAIPRAPSAWVSRAGPTRSWAWVCCVTCWSARAQPTKNVMARTDPTVTRPSTARVPSSVRASAIVVLAPRSRTMRSPRSASTPAGSPMRSRGAMRRASATPTRSGEFVRSSTSQPRTTCSPEKAIVLSMAELANRREARQTEERRLGGIHRRPTVARRPRERPSCGTPRSGEGPRRVRRGPTLRRRSGRCPGPGRRAPRHSAHRRFARRRRARARRCRTATRLTVPSVALRLGSRNSMVPSSRSPRRCCP